MRARLFDRYLYIFERPYVVTEDPGTRCRLRQSSHAANRMIGQGIGANEVLEAILKGAKRHEGHKVVSRFRGKEVVFIKKPCRYFLVTAYWLI